MTRETTATFDKDQMLRLIKRDTLLLRMYSDQLASLGGNFEGNPEKALETVFWSEVYGDPAMEQEYAK